MPPFNLPKSPKAGACRFSLIGSSATFPYGRDIELTITEKFISHALPGGQMWGRSSQREYWIWLGVIIAAVVGLSLFLPSAAGLNRILGMAWIIAWIRRLHDVGKTAWTVLIPLVMEFVVLGVSFWVLGQGFASALAGNETASSDQSSPYDLYVIMVIGVCSVVQIAFSVWLGVKLGDPGPNRFGPSPQKASENVSDVFR